MSAVIWPRLRLIQELMKMSGSNSFHFSIYVIYGYSKWTLAPHASLLLPTWKKKSDSLTLILTFLFKAQHIILYMREQIYAYEMEKVENKIVNTEKNGLSSED